MTPLVVIVGFLGSGKTTFLKKILPLLRDRGLHTRVIINDYQNASVDAAQLSPFSEEIRAITGDCVCCGSKEELLAELERHEHGPDRLVLVETNGTTDSEQLIELLSLEPSLRKFSLPLQVSLIDAQRWQKRLWHNALEREQARTASHIVVSRRDAVPEKRLAEVKKSLVDQRVRGRQTTAEELADELVALTEEFAGVGERQLEICEGCGHHHDEGEEPHHHEHAAHHFSSLELALPESVLRAAFRGFLKELPETVIRAKGVVRFAEEPGELYIFQKVDRFDEPQFFPLGASPKVNRPLALFIGPELPEEELRAATDALAAAAHA